MADEDQKTRAARERREAIERSIANGTFGKTPTPPVAARPKPGDVPLGTGMADKAKTVISGRQRQVDDAVEAAERGTLSSAKRPRAY